MRADKSLDPTASDFEPMGKRKRDVGMGHDIDGEPGSDGDENRREKRERSETLFEGEGEGEGEGEMGYNGEIEREKKEVVVCMRGD